MARRMRSSEANAAFAALMVAACLSGGPARADDIPAAIREVMQIESEFWSPKEPKRSIFSDDNIERLFSKDFVRLYRAAMKRPIYPDGETPFDFDIIVQAQDSCTLDDMKLTRRSDMDQSGKYYEVSFANFACFDDGGDKTRRTTIYFSVIEENERSVIDDVLMSEVEAEYDDSTKVLMANIAAGEPERLYKPR